MEDTHMVLSNIDAVAVTHGPGSYTGLRVGLASAKGICYALNKPLICIGTLTVMAAAARAYWSEKLDDYLIYPMIDARRSEVFMAAYTSDLQEIQAPQPLVLSDDFLRQLDSSKTIVFCGNGSLKISRTYQAKNHWFSETTHRIDHIVPLAELAFRKQQFANLAYAEPLYTKDFHDTRKQ